MTGWTRCWPAAFLSGSPCRNTLQTAEVIVYVHLKLANFIYWAFSEDGEIPGIRRENVCPQRLNGTAKVLDLFEGLLQLGFRFNHNVNRKIPLERPGSNRICWKNRT